MVSGLYWWFGYCGVRSVLVVWLLWHQVCIGTIYSHCGIRSVLVIVVLGQYYVHAISHQELQGSGSPL